ncbi:MAG: hypothetical protein ABIQ18_16940 [Umezawaea sp.]
MALAVTAVLAAMAGAAPPAFATADQVAKVEPGTFTVTIEHAGQDRTALVHVPTGYDGTSRLPTLLHFPGLYETPEIAELFGHHFAHADRHGYLMVIPAHYSTGWQGVPGGPGSPDVDDPGFIRALLDELKADYNADPARIYASGMSNGGFFTHLTACRLAGSFAAFAAVSGQLSTGLVSSCSPGRPLPILMIHGDGDPVVPIDVSYAPLADATRYWTTNNRCGAATTSVDLPNTTADNTTVTRHTWTGCPANAPVVFYEINRGGHTWPGGTPFLPPPLLGWHCTDINANDVIWNFVAPHRLPDTAS